ncbi:MAG: GNAT family N-acetyltransferase, partial [Bacteroidaceae bacterium]|nr:GNAT family N-acetyltransferase [Bacteroidaceae bacterium]
MEIRKVTVDDAKELLDIYAPYVEQTAITFEYDVPSVGEFVERIKKISSKYPYIAAVEDGKIVGYAYASAFKERAAYQWSVETSIYVDMQKRQNGVGRLLYEALEQCFDEGQSCAALLGHYANWEYLSATGLSMRRHSDAVMGLIYHPLRNAVFDRLFIALREQHGGTAIPKKDILRYLLRYRQEHRMSLFGYIADQSPKWENIHLWIPFLHHDTPVFTGAERIIRKMNNAVFYVDMERPRRGHYICTFRLITREPAQWEEHQLTRRFFELLEESIRREPVCYLWSHD